MPYNLATVRLALADFLRTLPDVERVESLAENVKRQQREYEEAERRSRETGEKLELLPPMWPERWKPPEDVLVVTFMDQSQFGVKVNRMAYPDRLDDAGEAEPGAGPT